jgi:hypothetical protein
VVLFPRRGASPVNYFEDVPGCLELVMSPSSDLEGTVSGMVGVEVQLK